ncbi:MAG: NAD(+) synthase [Christensenellaceae bacterium]
MKKFEVEKVANDIIEWIRAWFEKNGKGCVAVVGISGGKDSSVVAALCVKALGRDRVVGVLMPNGVQSDIDYSKELVKELGITSYTVNIEKAAKGITGEVESQLSMTKQARENLLPRLRMSALYAVSQSVNGRVANTCNLSEDYVGYSTRYGDSVGDFSPVSNLVVREVKAVGRYLGLSEKFIEKPPIDGLSGKTDEENLGFTYATLDSYIRDGIEPSPEIKEKIDRLNRQNAFKLKIMDSFPYEP